MTSNPVNADTIRAVLGKVFRLYVQTHCYHWNVEGPFFRSLHAMFEAQYKTLNAFMDTVAEQLRVLDVKAPASLDDLVSYSNAPKSDAVQTADDMVRTQITAFQDLIDTLRTAIQVLADIGDDGTVGVLTDTLAWTEKEHWMMSASTK